MITTAKQRDSLQGLLTDVLLVCDEDWSAKTYCGNWEKPLLPSLFSGCECLIETTRVAQSEIHYFDPDDLSLNDLPDTWSVSMVSQSVNDDGSTVNDLFRNLTLSKVSRLPLKRVRNAGPLLSPYCIELQFCFVNMDTMGCLSHTAIFNLQYGRWVCLRSVRVQTDFMRRAQFYGTKQRYEATTKATSPYKALTDVCDIGESLRTAMSIAFCRDLHWYVQVKGIDNKFSFQIPTDPHGALAAFKDRDKSTSGRRDALLHWVKEHHRRKRVDGELTDDMIAVCQYLRGRVPFRWRGLDCELIAAPFDVRRVLAAKEKKRLVSISN